MTRFRGRTFDFERLAASAAADHPFHRRAAPLHWRSFKWAGRAPMLLGSVWFFIALILVGSMLPIVGIVNERKKQNLAFLMSLPISAHPVHDRETGVDCRDVSCAVADAGDRRAVAD